VQFLKKAREEGLEEARKKTSLKNKKVKIKFGRIKKLLIFALPNKKGVKKISSQGG